MTEEVEFQDDDTISDDSLLYRRIFPGFINWSKTESDGRPKIPSQGFQDYPEERARQEFGLPGACMSVDLGYILDEQGFAPERLLEGYGDYGLVVLNVGQLRHLKGPNGQDWTQGIMRDPRPDAPWHAVAFACSGKKTSAMKNAISGVARWVFVPANRGGQF
ncbi:hypothetical protein [Micromonospora sp. WMMA2032]|uniref:hypothetical protein n=1 Tax=Micromonospora sp. WMMA2032 TaxID=2039870 RepID=UPI0012FDE500|nr:hypothetical protein [Micromonospora sp. WMMA2032]